MSSARNEIEREKIEVTVDNIGGIGHTDVSFTPGVTILAGRNATNRTSLLQALMATLGSEHVSVKGDAKEGHADLTINGTTYSRILTRANGSATDAASITTSGDPYLDDTSTEAELADLFAFLLESNEARRAVAQSDDLRDLIMRPVDTDAIQAEIDQLESEKRQIENEIDQLDTLEDRLPELEAELTDLDERIEEKREAFEEAESELEDADADVDETREEKAELEDKLDELSTARSAVENARLDIESEQKSIEALREEHDELEDNLDTPSEEDKETASPAAEIDDIETQLEQRRDQLQSLETTVNELQTVIQFNEDMLEGESASTAVLNALRGGDEETSTGNRADALTDQLLADTDVVCWTCGSEVDQERIETTLDRLREVRTEQFEERRSIKNDIDELEARKQEIETQQRQREQQQRELRNIEAEIDDREARLEDLQDEREEREQEVKDLESEVEDLQEEEYSELLDLHKRANQLEFEVERLQRERDDLEEEIESVESQLAEREQLEAQHDELQAELTDLRGQIERIEKEAITEFNEHMETVLELLDYANIERIWLERRETEVREGRRKVPKSVFDLHVIRSTESGSSYEDTIEHLSESEREVTGLVFALAGYLAHDVHEHLPFMLLDSVEAIDSDRIAALVEYFSEYAEYLLVALLPEDDAALNEDYQRVTVT